MSTDRLRSDLVGCLKTLRLPTIRQAFAQQAELARREGQSYEHYLLDLLQQECEVRQHNRTLRFLRESKLPLEKSLEMFDRTRLPAPQNALVATLVDGAFLDRTENVLAFGPPGSGKTHLLCAIAQTLIHQGRRILFTPWQPAGTGTPSGQTRSALATPPQTLCQIRCPPPRRYRLRPA